MTETHLEVFILADAEGHHYLMSRDLFDQTRVPAHETGELERLIQSADTSGFAAPGAFPTLTPVGSLVVPRKAGGGQHEYLIVKFRDLYVSG